MLVFLINFIILLFLLSSFYDNYIIIITIIFTVIITISGFVEIAPQHDCSPVGLFHV